MSGTLTVCATPIGNLDDVSLRLLATLREVALICAEDTRHTSRLLARHEISTPLSSYHQHSSPAKVAALARRMVEGDSLALVTDSGTPGISDPGPALVLAAIEAGVEVCALPGPCALIAALSISGFDAQRFSFLGFLPKKPGKRRKALEAALLCDETLVFYESPHRVLKVLAELAEITPDAPLVVCRELTKKFEECWRGAARDVVAQHSGKEARGEFVVVVGKVDAKEE